MPTQDNSVGEINAGTSITLCMDIASYSQPLDETPVA